jgi:hypothetical protein
VGSHFFLSFAIFENIARKAARAARLFYSPDGFFLCFSSILKMASDLLLGFLRVEVDLSFSPPAKF